MYEREIGTRRGSPAPLPQPLVPLDANETGRDRFVDVPTIDDVLLATRSLCNVHVAIIVAIISRRYAPTIIAVTRWLAGFFVFRLNR